MNDSTALIMLAAITAITFFLLYKGYPSFSQKTGNRRIYIRMILGGISGGVFFFSASYLWAWYNNNINPISGLGIMVIGAVGIVVGALIGAIRNQKKDTNWEVGICVCPCHERPHAVVHPVECCDPCPKCKRGIARGSMAAHLQVCAGRGKNKVRPTITS